MAFEKKTSIAGVTVSAVPNIAGLQPDTADIAAAYFDSRLLLRVDPRDVVRNAQNPTGAKKIHLCEPNRDALLFSGTNMSVGKVAGKYNGKDAFRFTTGGTPNNLRTRPKSLNNVTEFTVFGVAHFDAAMMGTAGFHTLVSWCREGSLTPETVLAHQYAAGVNYLSLYADFADSGGVNINIDSGGVVSAGTPFAYMLRVVGTSTANSRVSIYVNQTATETAAQAGSGVPEPGSIQLFLGQHVDSTRQWIGGHAKLLVIQGSTIGNAGDIAATAALMAALKAEYGIA